MPTLRLDKYLVRTGLYSRSDATALIRKGRVGVDGRAAVSGAEKYDPETVSVTVDGAPVEYREFRYIMLNKPGGYLSSTSDNRGKTVMELLDGRYARMGLYPAGRLDKDAEGFLLLTNDGELAHRITSPLGKIDKQYFVEIDGRVSESDIETFKHGLILSDGTRCRPAVLEAAGDGAIVTVREGKFHQVKRMMAAIGKPVLYIKRIAIGGLKLDEDLKPGEYRELRDEIKELLNEK